MSWDLFVANIPDSFQKSEDVPRDWRPPVLGTGNQLIQQIRAHFQSLIFAIRSLGTFPEANTLLRLR